MDYTKWIQSVTSPDGYLENQKLRVFISIEIVDCYHKYLRDKSDIDIVKDPREKRNQRSKRQLYIGTVLDSSNDI